MCHSFYYHIAPDGLVCAVLSSGQSRRLPLEKVLQCVFPPVSCTPRCMPSCLVFEQESGGSGCFSVSSSSSSPCHNHSSKREEGPPPKTAPPPSPPPHSAISKSITNFMAYTRTDGCGIPRALKGPVDRAFLKMKIVKLLRSYLFFLFFKDENTSRQFSPTFCAFFL